MTLQEKIKEAQRLLGEISKEATEIAGVAADITLERVGTIGQRHCDYLIEVSATSIRYFD